MNRSFCGAARMIIGKTVVACLLIGFAASLQSAELTDAELTRIIKDVKLLPVQAQARNAALNERISKGTAVRTGVESRAELTFKDLTITRLGENTLFSFDEGTRNLDLGGGAILVHVPKDSGGAKITTAAITAAITGTTVMLEVHKNNNSKAIVLEGHMRVALADNPNEWIELHAGQILVVPPHAKKMPGAQTVDLKTLVATSPFITEFSPLPSAPLIAEEIARQQTENPPGVVYEEPPIDTLSQRFDNLTGGGSGGGGPAPSKLGPIVTITSPNPYVINAGTSINTDPTITTGGKKDFGKIYQGPATDGPASTYFFGSQTLFDQDFDSIPEHPGRQQLAGFKFSGLRIDGDPTVSLGGSGPNALVLVSEGTITTGGAGTAVRFNNLNFVALATVAGNINLGGGAAFSNMNELFLYARGGGSSLTVGSPMIGIGALTLDGEGSVQINANEDVQSLRSTTTDFLAGTGNVTVHSGLFINAVNSVNFAMGNWSFDPITTPSVNLSGTTINIDASSNPDAFKSASLVDLEATTKINFTGANNVTFSNGTVTLNTGSGGLQAANTGFVSPGNALDIFSNGGDIVVKSIVGGDSIQTLGGQITTSGDLSATNVTASGDVTVGNNLTSSNAVTAGGNVTVTNNLTVNEVDAPGDIDAKQVQALVINGSSTGTLSAGTGGIKPYVSAAPSTTHNFTIATVDSHTAAVGLDFSGNNFAAAGSAGGILNLFTEVQAFSATTGINVANFNGQDAPGLGQTPGDGGTFRVTSNQAITLDAGLITATTGIIDNTAATAPAGHGGNVNLTSNGAVNVTNSSKIQVSSADPAGSANRRSSAAGGNITLQSNAASGVAIQVTSSSQLLALLDNAAPGPGGKIILHATGAAGSVQAGGNIFADKGAVDIRADGGDVSVASANLRGDVIKVATLGTNGSLNIGASNTINAGTVLKLYAEGSNGTLNFTSNVTLSGQSVVLAAHVINITLGATVTVNSPIAGSVFTDTANYVGSGGSGSSTGTLVNASNPQPFANRPALGGVGGP